jgi:hypothetical protein
MRLGIALGATLLLQTPASAQPVTCTISAKYACDMSGCNPVQATVRNVVDQSRQTYARCDSRGCDTFDAHYSRSGAFIVIDVPGRGMTAKISDEMSKFVEITTLGTLALVSFGACRS